jgi:hypothetical protein
VNQVLGGTTVGGDMLMQDYLLKQLAASMTFPDREPGKAFWEQVYAKVKQQYGDVELPLNTFSKVWVVPQKAVVYEQNGVAFIGESRLKVMLDADYLTMKKEGPSENVVFNTSDQANGSYLTIAREIIIPALEREVNEGRYFSELRQMYNSLILAIWFKRKLRGNIVNKIYADQKKVSGIQIEDKQIAQKVYEQYMLALKKGVYDIIREYYDPDQQEMIPRHYFSGGFSFEDAAERIDFLPTDELSHLDNASLIQRIGRNLSRLTVSLIPRGMSRKSLMTLVFVMGLALSTASNSGSQSANLSGTMPVNTEHHLPSAGVGTPSKTVLAEVSRVLIRKGDVIPVDDQKYFMFMKDSLTIEDVKGLVGKKNPLTGVKYTFDADYIERNWDKVFAADRMGWAQEAIVIVLQHKLGTEEDGVLGPNTRRGAECRMSGTYVASGSELSAEAQEETDVVETKQQASPVTKAGQAVSQATQQNVQKPVQPIASQQEKQAVVEKKKPVVAQSAGSAPPPPPPPPEDDEKISVLSATPAVTPTAVTTGNLSAQNVPPVMQNAASAQQNGSSVQSSTLVQQSGSSVAQSPPAAQPSYKLDTQVAVVPQQIEFTSQATGTVTGFSGYNGAKYKKGDVIYTIIDDNIQDDIDKIQVEYDSTEKRLNARRSVNSSSWDISDDEANLAKLKKELAALNLQKKILVVRAPCALSLRDIKVSNNRPVGKDQIMFNYLPDLRLKLTVEMPENQVYFGDIRRFEINGHQVKRVLEIKSVPVPARRKAMVTFLVEPSAAEDINVAQSASVNIELASYGGAVSQISGRGSALTYLNEGTTVRAIPAMAEGPVQSDVDLGDYVRKGQRVGLQAGASVDEYNELVRQHQIVMEQIKRGKDKPGSVGRVTMDDLVVRAGQLEVSIKSWKKASNGMILKAQEDGVITSINFLEQPFFSRGQPAMWQRTKDVFLGDMFDMTKAILLYDNLGLELGDTLVVQTPFGALIPAKITQINPKPVGFNGPLTGRIAVEVCVDDSDYLLSDGLWVKVIVPTDAELELVLKNRGGVSTTSVNRLARGSSKGSVQRKVAGSVAGSVGSPVDVTLTSESRDLPQIVVPSSFHGKMLTPEQSASMVADNFQINGNAQLNVLSEQAREKLVNNLNLGLNLGLTSANGKVSFVSGVNFVGKGVSLSGLSLTQAGTNIIGSLASDLVRVMAKEPQKERALHKKTAEQLEYRFYNIVNQNIYDEALFFVQLGHARLYLDHLKVLHDDLQSALVAMQASAAEGFSTTTEIDALKRDIADVQSNLGQWTIDLERWKIKSNALKGTASEGGEFAPKLPWDGSFADITEAEEAALLQELTGPDSPNYRLKEARAALEAKEMAVKLQKLERVFPTIDVNAVYHNGVDGNQSVVDLVAAKTIKTKPGEGPGSVVNIHIPLFNSKKDAFNEIAANEVKKEMNDVERIKSEISAEFKDVSVRLRHLSRQIPQAEVNEKAAYEAWQNIKTAPNWTLEQINKARIHYTKMVGISLDLKAQFFKAEAQERLLMGNAPSRVIPKVVSAAKASFQEQVVQGVESSVAYAMGGGTADGGYNFEDEWDGEQHLHGPRVSPLASGTTPGASVGSSVGMASLSVSYVAPSAAFGASGLGTAGGGGSSQSASGGASTGSIQGGQWAAMSEGHIPGQDIYTGIAEMLKDPNPYTSMQALEYLSKYGQSDAKYLEVFEKVVLDESTDPNVVQRILEIMSGQDDVDPRFFIYVIDQAIRQNKIAVAQKGFYFLNDMLTRSPLEMATQLAKMKYNLQDGGDYPHVDPQDVRKVLLTFLASAPDHWIGKFKLLQGDSSLNDDTTAWTVDDLANIHKTLVTISTPQAQNLAALIYDELLRRECEDGLERFQWPFGSGVANAYPSYMYPALKAANSRFLKSSPQWRQMQEHVRPDVFSDAKAAVDDLLASAEGLDDEDPFYDIPPNNGVQDPTGLMDLFMPNDQTDFVVDGKSMSELGRIFQDQPALRSVVIVPLMATAEGRVRILQAYTQSDDFNLLAQVEFEFNLLESSLKEDIQHINDPVSMDIIRQAMEKMYARKGYAWFLNIRLRTYAFPELHTASDPRGIEARDAFIRLLAMEMAVDMLEGKEKTQLFSWGGRAPYSLEETSTLEEIKSQLLLNAPDKFEPYLKLLQVEKNSPMLRDLLQMRDKIATTILENDQDLPTIPSSNKWWLLGLGAFVTTMVYKVFRRKQYLNNASTDTLIVLLRNDLIGEGSKRLTWNNRIVRWLLLPGAFGPSRLTFSQIPDTGFHNSSRVRLQKINDMIKKWNNSKDTGFDDIADDVNQALNDYNYILRTMPYKAELMGRGDENGEIRNGQYQKTFHYFYLSILELRNALDHYLQASNDLNDRQKERLLLGQDSLNRTADYVSEYLDIFECRGSIDKLMGYRYHFNHQFETSKFYPAMREGQGYGFQTRTSYRRIFDRLPELFRKGEALIPGLYPQEEQMDIYKKSKDILDDMIANAEPLHVLTTAKAASKDRRRRFWSRVLFYLMPLSIVAAVVLNIFVIPFVTITVTVSAIGGMLLKFYVFWRAQMNITKRLWLEDMDRIMKKLDKSLEEKLQVEGFELPKNDSDREKVVARHAVEEGLEELAKELKRGKNGRGVDLIMIIPEHKQHVPGLDKYIARRRGKIIHNDMPVVVAPTTLFGSGNVYWEGMAFLQDQLADEKFLEANPQLRGRALKDINLVCVFHGNNEHHKDIVLDWALINGYRAAAKARQADPEAQGGLISIYSRDVYLGPMFKFSAKDINLMGDWVNRNDLRELGLLELDPDGKSNAVSKVREKPNIKKWEDKEKQSLDRSYNFSNDNIRQFPALGGIMVFNARTVRLLEYVLNGLRRDPELWDSLKQLHMTSDIINLLLRSKKDIKSAYLEERINQLDVKRRGRSKEDEDLHRKIYRRFFDLFIKAKKKLGNDFKADAIVPAYGAAQALHLKNAVHIRKAKDILTAAGMKDEAQVVADEQPDLAQISQNGGIDLSTTSDQVSLHVVKENDLPLSLAAPGVPASYYLQLFRGFDFSINGLQPLEDPRMFLFR